MAKVNKCARLLAYVTGLVNQKLLLQKEYLAAENRILRSHSPPRLRLSDPERQELAEIGTQGSGPGCLCCEAGYDSALVSQTDRGKVRRFQASLIPWSAVYQSRGGSADRQTRPRKRELGLRPDRRGSEKSGLRSFRSDGWECFAPSRD